MDRFWDKVDKSGECWTWTASSTPAGYGTFFLDGKTVLAHRLSYEMACGPIPRGLLVMHSCDNPPCVNPDHLSVGTHSDNAADMMSRERGRHIRGSDHYAAKITEEDAACIRRSRGTGITQSRLAEIFGICQSNVSRIQRGEYWAI